MAAIARIFVLVALLCGFRPALATPHVFLVQNSGWMEPFYGDPQSQFKPLVTELALSVAQPGDALVLAAFNQSQPNAPSPRALVSTTVDKSTRLAVTRALAGLDTARKAGGALAATASSGSSPTTATARTTTRQQARATASSTS